MAIHLSFRVWCPKTRECSHAMKRSSNKKRAGRTNMRSCKPGLLCENEGMELGPAHSLSQGFTRTAILLVLVLGFFGTFAVGFWLGNKWFGGFRIENYSNHRIAILPFSFLFVLYILVAMVLIQFW
ncbi:MAG: hypothetical protein ABI191_02875 [Rhizomicrobium sp.]